MNGVELTNDSNLATRDASTVAIAFGCLCPSCDLTKALAIVVQSIPIFHGSLTVFDFLKLLNVCPLEVMVQVH